MKKETEELGRLLRVLLAADAAPQERRNSVQAMHRLFVSLGAVNVLEDPVNLPDHLYLPDGVAIAPRQAGLCLLEARRTQVFAAALRDAIGDLLRQFPGRTIRVLDAGCGPYALLPLLASFFYTPQQVQFTLLDIHSVNLDSAATLISSLGLSGYFSSFVQADATTCRFPEHAVPDIIISETMNKGLQKEPQVAITLNLAPQLPPHGILLPQQVSVVLRRIHTSLRTQALQDAHFTTPDYSRFEDELGTVFCLHRQTTPASVQQQPLCRLQVPADYDEACQKLQLDTIIEVYADQVLQRSDCSLTLPLQLEPYGRTTVKAGDELAFAYELSATPGIVFTRQEAVLSA